MEKQSIIIDDGSYQIKAGRVGDDQPDYPTVRFTNRYGVLKDTQIVKGINDHYFWIGEDICNNKGLIKISHPLMDGVVNNWDQMEKVFYYTFFNELRTDPSNHPVLITDSPLNNDQNRYKITQLMFESFKVPEFSLANQAILSIYSSGRLTGLVLDSGYDNTISVPIYEGQVMKNFIQYNTVAGKSCTQYLKVILREINLYLDSYVEQEIIKDIKEKACYVQDIHNKKLMILSHLNCLMQYRCAEILFQPIINNIQQIGAHQLIIQSLQDCNQEILNQMYNNIILSGGSTKFPGYEDRLLKEIKQLTTEKSNLKIIAYKERENLVWIGGQIISELQSNANLFITASEYKEYGSNIIHKKII
ncbi:hypothetical protein pb186bvf_011940 [Paramecium bursaria]